MTMPARVTTTATTKSDEPLPPSGRGVAAVRANGEPSDSLRETVADDASSLEPLTDALLIQRIRRGETLAGQVLVLRYCEPLLRYLRRLVGSDHLAEELHQQTWLSVLEHLDTFDLNLNGAAAENGHKAVKNAATTSGFKPWLFRIATNKANDLWRSKGRERVAKTGMRLIVETESPEASDRINRSEQDERLKMAIDQLPESQQQVLLLRYYSGMKFVEIAEMLGCPLNTALGRMHKAMLKLKDVLAN